MEEKGEREGGKQKFMTPRLQREPNKREAPVAQHNLACAYAKPRNKGTSEPKLGRHKQMQEVEVKKKKKIIIKNK